MNGSRRRTCWRLAALAGLMCLLTAVSVSAQGLRVIIGPATIFEHPRTSSDVVLTVPAGTVLEALKREGDWYWVVLPPDEHGSKRAGYVPAYMVERLGDKRLPEPGLVGGPSKGLPGALGPKTEPDVFAPRILIGLGGGGQFGSAKFVDQVTFRLYQEAGNFTASYRTKNAGAIDATVGVRLGPQFVLAFGFWRTKPTTVADATTKVPHPLQSFKPRTASGSGLATARAETDGHLQVTYLVPVTRRIQLSLFAGPSVFYLRQDLIGTFGYREAYPYDAVSIEGFATQRKSKAVLGGHFGGDLSVMLWKFVGVGIGGRYAHGHMNLPSAGDGSLPVDVGGAQFSGGVRLRF